MKARLKVLIFAVLILVLAGLCIHFTKLQSVPKPVVTAAPVEETAGTKPASNKYDPSPPPHLDEPEKTGSAPKHETDMKQPSDFIEDNGDRLAFREGAAEALVLTAEALEEITRLSVGWIAEVKQMEKAGTTLVEQGPDSFYTIGAERGLRKEFIVRVRAEVAAVVGIKNAEATGTALLEGPWLRSIGSPYEVAFTPGENGMLHFNAPDMDFLVSPESAKAMELGKKRYGHLFNFDEIAERYPAR